MKAKELPPLEYLRECFELSDESPSGLIWKRRPREHFDFSRGWNNANTQFANKPAGTINKKNKDSIGYWRVRIGGIKFYVHQVIFKLLDIKIPDGYEIDHKDGNGLNNKHDNLRLATSCNNQCNKKKPANETGLKGVRRRPGKHGDVYSASIVHNKKKIFLGISVTPELAHAAYCEASKRLHGEFGRTA